MMKTRFSWIGIVAAACRYVSCPPGELPLHYTNPNEIKFPVFVAFNKPKRFMCHVEVPALPCSIQKRKTLECKVNARLKCVNAKIC